MLKDYIKMEKARPFHVRTCPHCHSPTNFTKWEEKNKNESYEIEYWDSFEPFYISHTNTTPYYDERFKAYGFDRISQLCEMYIKGTV